MSPYRPEGNTSGAKARCGEVALIAAPFTARLKSCPDTEHESGGSSGLSVLTGAKARCGEEARSLEDKAFSQI